MRFLTAMVASGQGPLPPRRRAADAGAADRRPARRPATARASKPRSEPENGCPPVVIEAQRPGAAATVRMRGDVSSQFLSGLLMAAPFAGHDDVRIEIDGDARVRAVRRHDRRDDATTGACTVERRRTIDYFVSSAMQWLHDRDRVRHRARRLRRQLLLGRRRHPRRPRHRRRASPSTACKATSRFVDVLEQMGCRVEKCDAGITVHGGPLRGIDVDMNAISDTVMTLGGRRLLRRGADAHPQRRPHPPQGDRPHRRPGDRAAPARGRGRGVRRRADDHAAAVARRRGRDVQRPPHGDEPGPDRPAGAGRRHQEPRLRREDVSGLLGGPGEVARW